VIFIGALSATDGKRDACDNAAGEIASSGLSANARQREDCVLLMPKSESWVAGCDLALDCLSPYLVSRSPRSASIETPSAAEGVFAGRPPLALPIQFAPAALRAPRVCCYACGP
jgi:hypothetical protein